MADGRFGEHAAGSAGVDDHVVAIFGEGVPIAAHSFPSAWANNPDLEPYPFEPETAMALLDDAGWVDDDDWPELDLPTTRLGAQPRHRAESVSHASNAPAVRPVARRPRDAYPDDVYPEDVGLDDEPEYLVPLSPVAPLVMTAICPSGVVISMRMF